MIHIASCSQLHDLNQSSATLPPGVSEVEAGGLSTTPVEGYRMPRLSDARIAMMCSRYRIDEIGDKGQRIVYGEISSIYVDDDCTETNDKGRLAIKADRIEPLARLGASQYASFGKVLSAKRPT